MGIINRHTIDNGDVEVHLESNSEYDTDKETNPIKSIDDVEMVHLMELFHSEHYDDLLDFYLQILQA